MKPPLPKKKPRLYQRIILFQVLSIAGIMIISGFFTYQVNFSRETAVVKSATDQAATRLASGLSIPFWNLERRTVENLLRQEIQSPYLAGVVLYHTSGLWFGMAKNEDGSVTVIEKPEDVPRLLGRSLVRPQDKITYTDAGGRTWDVGELVVFSTDKPINDTLMTLLFQSVIQALLLTLTLSILTVLVLDPLLNRPLRHITRTAERIGDGEIGLQAEPSVTRELNTLAETFNTMTARLRDSLEEFDWYFTNAREILCVTDSACRLHRLNREWVATLQHTVDESLNHYFLDFIHPDDRERTRRFLERILHHGEAVDLVNRCLRRNGGFRWLEWRCLPYGDGIYAAARDITERREAEEEIRRLNESLEARVAERTARLQEMNREMETFAYSISHDLRAPLRAINGYVHIIGEEYGRDFDDEGTRILSVVKKETTRMDAMIGSLLEFSRIGRSAIKKEFLDMTELAQSAFDAVIDPQRREQVEFRLHTLPPAAGDATLIGLIWMNLLTNAVKFSSGSRPSSIEVSGVKKDSELVYSVRDNGAGFDPRYRDKLFGVFQRLHAADEFEGNGIGLAIVQRIVIMHGGRVWAESEPGKGATFSFTLPLPPELASL